MKSDQWRESAVRKAAAENTIVRTTAWSNPFMVAFPDGTSAERHEIRERPDGLVLRYEWRTFGTGMASSWADLDRERMEQAVRRFRA